MMDKNGSCSIFLLLHSSLTAVNMFSPSISKWDVFEFRAVVSEGIVTGSCGL